MTEHMLAAIFLPVVVGAVLGAVGSLLFIMRASVFSKEEYAQGALSRQSAVRRVLVIYATIAWICLAAAVAIGDMSFIILTGIIAVLASVGLVGFWSLDS
jgi:hypothetical protein